MGLHYFGKMDVICKDCKENHFAAENPQDGEFSRCWHKGKINLPPMTPPPEYGKNLSLKNTADSKKLKKT